jgi:uncharacterized protein (UPF0262 family)
LISFISYPRTTIYRGDQGDEQSLLRLIDNSPKYRIIIDDGSHISNHQQLSLEMLFPLVESKGYYIIEDLYILFPYDKVTTGIRTVDLLRRWINNDWYNPNMNNERFQYLKDNIDSIELYCNDRLVVIRKK